MSDDEWLSGGVGDIEVIEATRNTLIQSCYSSNRAAVSVNVLFSSRRGRDVRSGVVWSESLLDLRTIGISVA